jgi:PPOX class probable FMN-dependent enzyme
MDQSGSLQFIDDEATLRALLGTPSETVRRKQLSTLDVHARAFLERSPFCLLATSARDGSCDVSPRGDEPGFVAILGDDRIALPDRPGNKRLDNFRNILENGSVGLLFIVPGMEETLRVNGRARLVQDAPWFDQLEARGKKPLVAVLVEIDEVFFHCPKAFKRSQLWDSATWPDRSELPTLGRILKDQVGLEQTVAEVDRELEASYVRSLY